MVEATGTERAELVITRDSDADIKMRGLEIYVDDQYEHDLQYGRSFRKLVAPGLHKVMVSNHLYKKRLSLELKAGERVNLLAGNRFTILGGIMVAVLGMGPYIVFLRPAEADISEGIAASA